MLRSLSSLWRDCTSCHSGVVTGSNTGNTCKMPISLVAARAQLSTDCSPACIVPSCLASRSRLVTIKGESHGKGHALSPLSVQASQSLRSSDAYQPSVTGEPPEHPRLSCLLGGPNTALAVVPKNRMLLLKLELLTLLAIHC